MSAINKAGSQLAGKIGCIPLARTATASGTAVDCSEFEGIGAVVILTGAQDTAGTAKFLVETSPTSGGQYTALASFGTLGTGYTETSVSANQVLVYPIDFDMAQQFVKITHTNVAGTGLTTSVALVGVKKVSG